MKMIGMKKIIFGFMVIFFGVGQTYSSDCFQCIEGCCRLVHCLTKVAHSCCSGSGCCIGHFPHHGGVGVGEALRAIAVSRPLAPASSVVVGINEIELVPSVAIPAPPVYQPSASGYNQTVMMAAISQQPLVFIPQVPLAVALSQPNVPQVNVAEVQQQAGQQNSGGNGWCLTQ